MMNFIANYELAEKLEKLADVARYLDMTPDEIIQELMYMAKIHRDQADREEQEVAMELDRMYQDDPVIPF
jgi:acetolactate synthase small subunit